MSQGISGYIPISIIKQYYAGMCYGGELTIIDLIWIHVATILSTNCLQNRCLPYLVFDNHINLCSNIILVMLYWILLLFQMKYHDSTLTISYIIK